MYKINGYFPLVRCVCGREMLLKRATVCVCGATIRTRWPRHGRRFTPYGSAPDEYDRKAQPYKAITVIGWQPVGEALT